MYKKNVNIVLLNYNGKQLLEKYLPSVVEASKNSAHHCTVSVIDNKSSDSSVDFLRKNFPDVTIYEAKENRVLCSFNDYLNIIADEIVIFLNTDIRVDPYFVDPLIKHFDDKDVLFVAPKELSMKGKYQGNLNRLSFRLGLISTVVQDKKYDVPQYDASVHGGAFDRAKFLYLGGYDDLYLPGIVEDLDLCYRGWKHGWKGIYEPESFYYHEGSTSFKATYGNRVKTLLAYRNTFLFFWKNVTSKRMILMHIISMPFLFIINILRARWLFIKGFFLASARLPEALKRRRAVARQFNITDEEVMRKTQGDFS